MQRTAQLIVLASLMSSLACAQDPMPTPTSSATAGQPAEFSAGMKAMNASKWKEAMDDFDKVHGAGDDVMAQALYWKAYNLEKLDRRDDAIGTCVQLQQKYPQSQWTPECVEMSANVIRSIRTKDGQDIEIRTKVAEAEREMSRAYTKSAEDYRDKNSFFITMDPSGANLHPDVHVHFGGKIDPNDEIKLIALNSLMEHEPEKALPVLRTFLATDKSVEVKRRAMFVLEQSKSPEAQKLLVDTATSTKEPELQRAAVSALADHPKEHTGDLLSIYKASTDHEVKRAAAVGLMSAKDAKDLVEIARAEKDPEMKRAVVQYLSEMRDPDALAYMEELLK